LAFAGFGTSSCFVYYERGGGPGLPVACLAIIDYKQKKTLWVGESTKKAENLNQLRNIFRRGFFADALGPVC
jgi:heptaprenylglyceryl phosphate synthase